jgi:hypothetical protein
MSFDAEQFVRYQIANAPVRPYPFPHFYVRPVFPEPFYQELLEHLPPTDIMKRIGDAGTVGQRDDMTGAVSSGNQQPRWITDVATIEEHEESSGRGDTWRKFSTWLLADDFRDLLMQKFSVGISERFGPGSRLRTEVEARFVRDFTNYSIGPHTDTPRKLMSLLFYLPQDERLSHAGTSVYVPQDPSFRCEGTTWYKFKSFRKVATMGFAPNALFAFLKTDRSFHGVEQIADEGIERNSLLYNIYVNKVVTQPSQPTRSGAARTWWPWSREANLKVAKKG